jgi:hypothetical protein
MAAACGLVLAVAATANLALAQTAADPSKPIAVIGLSSYDELMQDADFIGGIVGMPGASQMADMILTQRTGGKGLAGLDKSKPIGVLVQAAGMSPSFGVCVPVTDQAALLDLTKMVGAMSKDLGDGVTQLSVFGQDLYAKNSSGWMLMGMAPEQLASLPADPGAVLGPLTADYDLAVQVNVPNVPEAWKQQAFEMMNNAAKGGLSKRADESDADYAARTKTLEEGLAQNQQMINEMDQFTFGLAIAGEQQKVYLDVAYTALPGTKLAEDIAAANDAKTNFAGFVQPEAAVSLSLATKVTGSSLAQIQDAMQQLRGEVNKSIDKEVKEGSREAVRAAFADFIDAIEATVKAGVADGGASLSLAPDAATLVVGGLITDSAKIESGLKKLAEAGAADSTVEMPKINWAADKAGDVTFHTMQIPVKKDEPKALVGDNLDVVVGIGPQAAYLAVGRNALEALKTAIEKSAAEPGKSVSPMALTVSLGPIMATAQAVAPPDKKPMLGMIAGMLNGEAAGRDHVRLVAESIPNGVRTRFEVEQGVLQAIGTAAMMGQMQAAGPPPGAVPAPVR